MGQIDKATSNRSFPWLTTQHIAHRGLHTAGTEHEENTLSAIKAAVDLGYSVEIDVQATVDGIIIVFHDQTVDRMTGGKGEVRKLGYSELQKLTVGASGKPIPSLPDVMEEIDGKAPIFVEIKSSKETDIQILCAGVRHCFEGYRGPVAIMSFDPRIVAWFKNYMPLYARGLNVGRDFLLNWRNRTALTFWLRRLKPDFIACDINLLPNSMCARWQSKGRPLLTWTVKSKELEAIAKKHSDALIFEAPAVVKNS
jgi:glycerophosphoryl diester phosphodiesterase